MENDQPLARDILDEDLQILRHTLVAIAPDIRRYSGRSADALKEAVEKLELAQREFAQPAYHNARCR
ncbi:MAG TPA: hypothetical protein VFT72_07415 [Opitutaceae bacterium]|nr:hypothetical protein [Opitutaceae bacterium]